MPLPRPVPRAGSARVVFEEVATVELKEAQKRGLGGGVPAGEAGGQRMSMGIKDRVAVEMPKRERMRVMGRRGRLMKLAQGQLEGSSVSVRSYNLVY